MTNTPVRAGGRLRPIGERKRATGVLPDTDQWGGPMVAVEEPETPALETAAPLRGPGPVSIDEPTDPTFADEDLSSNRHRVWNLSSTQYHGIAPIEADLPEPGTVAAGLAERIARRAWELWEESGRLPGRDVDNWLRAEREIHELFSER